MFCVLLLLFKFFFVVVIGLWLICFNLGVYVFGIIGNFFGIFGFFLYFWNICLYKWFFKEWKVIIEILLFIFINLIVCFIEFLKVDNLLFIVICSVWNICFVGCLFFFFVFVGIFFFIMLINFNVVVIGCCLWCVLIFWVICFENFFLL